jgi:uncharacterized protein
VNGRPKPSAKASSRTAAGPPPGRAAAPRRDGETTGKNQTCPICGKQASEAYRPFCSKRCADVDLNRWLSGRYAIPGAPIETPPETEETDEDA